MLKPTSTKQGKKQGVPEAVPNQHCDTCAHATYDMQHKNLSIYGTPTLIVCALHPFPKIVVGTIACGQYKNK